MSRVLVAAAVILLAPVAARADPIGVMLNSSSVATVNVQGGSSIDLGTLALGPGGTGTFFFNNAQGGTNYQVSLDLDLTGLEGIRLEVLDPLGDGNDQFDPADQPGYVPAGYSTSSDRDGLSFAQNTVIAGAFTASSFPDLQRYDEPQDTLGFSGSTVKPGESAQFSFLVTDMSPVEKFYLFQEPLQPVSELPLPGAVRAPLERAANRPEPGDRAGRASATLRVRCAE